MEKSPTNRTLHDHVMVNLLYSIHAVPYSGKPSMRINFRPFSISHFPPACNRVSSIYVYGSLVYGSFVYGRMSTGGGQPRSHHTCPYRNPCLLSNALPQNYSFCMVSIISGFWMILTLASYAHTRIGITLPFLVPYLYRTIPIMEKMCMYYIYSGFGANVKTFLVIVPVMVSVCKCMRFEQLSSYSVCIHICTIIATVNMKIMPNTE